MDECKRDQHTAGTIPNMVASETSSKMTLEPWQGGGEGLSALSFLTQPWASNLVVRRFWTHCACVPWSSYLSSL